MQIATFVIQEETFAIPSLVVEEYFRPLPITKVPGANRRIDGLVNIRGRTAVVINMRSCLDIAPRDPRIPGEMILLETTSGLVQEALDLGLYAFEEPLILHVDAVAQIHHLLDDAIYPSPPHVNQCFVDGVVEIHGSYFTMISLRKLIENVLLGKGKDQA